MFYLPKDNIQLQWAEEQARCSMKMYKKVTGMMSKSKEVQKTIWRPQKVIRIMSKSRDIQKAMCKPQEVEIVEENFSEVQKPFTSTKCLQK